MAQKYNRLCDDMAMLIKQKKAPQNAIAPSKIDMDSLFDLDVNNDIWLDVGLGYDDDDADSAVPPLWLRDNKVCSGI